MHVKTLVTVDIPAVAEDEAGNRRIREAVEALEQEKAKEPDNFVVQIFLEELRGKVNTFSRSVWNEVSDIMEPYNTATENPAYIEFIDCTEDLRSDFEGCVDCLKLPEGRIVEHCSYPYFHKYSIHDGKVYQKSAGPLKHEKRTKKAKRITVLPNYPRKKLYKTFAEYAEEYRGCEFDEERTAYGYYCNPNAMWDWYQIGGRWAAMFLVKDTCKEYSPGERSWCNEDSIFEAPEGFRWVTAARKKDIAWDTMRDWSRKEATERFCRLKKMFSSGQLEEKYGGRIVEDGIIGWRDYDYHKDETLEEYLERCGIPKSWKYPFHVSDIVDNSNWFNKDQSVLNSETQKYEPIDWDNFRDSYMDDLDDNIVLAGVDYHI